MVLWGREAPVGGIMAVGKGQSICFLGGRKEAETHLSVARVTKTLRGVGDAG